MLNLNSSRSEQETDVQFFSERKQKKRAHLIYVSEFEFGNRLRNVVTKPIWKCVLVKLANPVLHLRHVSMTTLIAKFNDHIATWFLLM